MSSSMAFSFGYCAAHIGAITADNPQVNPHIAKYFQVATIAMAMAVSWGASKLLAGRASIITANVWEKVNTLANELLIPNTMVVAEVGPSEMDTFTVIGLTSAKLQAFNITYTLDVAKANEWLPELLEELTMVKAVIMDYKMRVGIAIAYEMFFGYAAVVINTSATDMLYASAPPEPDDEAHGDLPSAGQHANSGVAATESMNGDDDRVQQKREMTEAGICMQDKKRTRALNSKWFGPQR
jgi:hypothetical protein